MLQVVEKGMCCQSQSQCEKRESLSNIVPLVILVRSDNPTIVQSTEYIIANGFILEFQ